MPKYLVERELPGAGQWSAEQRRKVAEKPGADLIRPHAAIGGFPANRISEIVGEKRGITAETALRLGRFFCTGSEFWAQLQTQYELAKAEQELGDTIRREVEEAA